MCGIAGVARWDGRPIERSLLKRMADTLVHRGPDEEGLYRNRAAARNEFAPNADSHGAAIGLAHRRLSIIDLSTGQQPLSNEDGTVWIVFNGEIYGYQPLRRELMQLGHRFRTNCDTEVIVHAYEQWGTDCLRHLNGMFAFAIWDEPRQQLFMARDRLGKKPLFYCAMPNEFVFGSELKAILAHPGVAAVPDPTAIADYFKYLYVPDPKSIYQGIRKLRPAHYMVARREGISEHEYWDVTFAEGSADSQVFEDRLFDVLEEAVRERMVADVPLGAFLSGGVDSSGVVALMKRQSSGPVVTCSIGFDDPLHDESGHAAAVARCLGTDHQAYEVKDDFVPTVRALPAMFDEPFADSSAIPTYFVSKMARQRVTVALSGDGGDEAFAGYEKYVKDRIQLQVGSVVPDFMLRRISSVVGGGGVFSRKAHTLTSQAMLTPARAFYASNTHVSDQMLHSLMSPQLSRTLNGYDPSEYLVGHFARCASEDPLSRMLYCDIKTYLPGDILTKVDRTSMANSLEVRAPLLDYRVIEFAATLPSALKIRWGNKKYLLKRAFSRVLPGEIFKRPKHGFTVPLDKWFRHDLVPLAQDAFAPGSEAGELLNLDVVRTLFNEHRSGVATHGTLLWAALMFCLWHRALRDARPGAGLAQGVGVRAQ
jgi:asparagine synthase (glutamine-hydrolysing)